MTSTSRDWSSSDKRKINPSQVATSEIEEYQDCTPKWILLNETSKIKVVLQEPSSSTIPSKEDDPPLSAVEEEMSSEIENLEIFTSCNASSHSENDNNVDIERGMT